MPTSNNRVGERIRALRKTGKKGVAFLIDPDDTWPGDRFEKVMEKVGTYTPLIILVGGSLVQKENVSSVIDRIRAVSQSLPVLLFPGSVLQLAPNADGVLFISLISGRNPDLLIGQQVAAAPLLAASNLEILPTGYLLVDGGKISSVHYMSQSVPLPNDKPDLAVATALAGYFLGMQFMYLEAGSGAVNPVSSEIIRAVSSDVPCPLIVGGGIDSIDKAKAAWKAGADWVVIGNAAQKNPDFFVEVLHCLEVFNLSLNVN
ncbi:MAG: geranylgeranylglyceryl/heptaprenylglyceryl phosphate synthase [Lunatimonas sp.]|uniref:geranylgeranylglyceryl/heptaprenylglyceryl phosphate synthase n=1 Tax=Lunatimonas sp. TaxID=2060141 RepID=UPI00263A5A36|nr:geranylgeranylglyceryl/heptaprenylglyceryl phosphate synthase [Lunatimonas sp.]MCC5937377.1 geranylgeranylglyceryl/heptaprenylglyceryl phosphate synthase [Lunatimonas sp.]